jgi:hypothetical protein
MLQRDSDEDRTELCDDPEAGISEDDPPIGFGRFLFRMSAIEERLFTALPYLDAAAMHLLFGTSKQAPTRRSTLLAGSADPPDQKAMPADLEREILFDFAPQIFPPNAPKRPRAGMTHQERVQLAVDLAHSIPLPALLKKLAFGTYRLWLRWYASREANRIE